jgi:hypothetical protein
MTREELATLILADGKREISRRQFEGFVDRRVAAIRQHDPKIGLSKSLIYSGKEAEFVDQGEPAEGEKRRTRVAAAEKLTVWLQQLSAEIRAA